MNEPGSLAQIAQVIAEHDGNIDNIRMTRRAPDFTDVLIDLEVYDLKHLTAIIAQLRAKPVVAKAERVNGLIAMIAPPLRLGVNIDHVATIRNARGGRHPDPVRAAKLAIAAGADGITAHLREDRRHIRDDDIARLKAEIDKPLNFEMAATDEMLAIALKTQPHAVCLVPEKRTERTTEGGLDAVRQRAQLAPVVHELKHAGIRVSLFIAAAPAQIEAAAALGAPVIEIHTGAWCDALIEERAARSRRRMAAHPRRRAAGARASGSKCMPATASTMRARRRSRRCRRSSSSISGISWSARRCSRGWPRPSSSCARRWTAGAPRRCTTHDYRPRLRHHRRAAHRAQ